VPATWLKYPKGIRDVEEWYVSTVARRDYVYKCFEKQCEIALANLEKLHGVVGERVTAVFVTGTDFGTQTGPFISRAPTVTCFSLSTSRSTPGFTGTRRGKASSTHAARWWDCCLTSSRPASTFSTRSSARQPAMDPRQLKARFGEHVTFWGGGVDTQHTLPFGTPDEVRRQVRERIEIFGSGGGFVFNPIHNVQSRTPVENMLAMFERCGGRSLSPGVITKQQ